MVFFLPQWLAHLPHPPQFQTFLDSSSPLHPLRTPLFPSKFIQRKSVVALRFHATLPDKSPVAPFCSSSTLPGDPSSCQHVWMNKSQHRFYLGPNWSKPLFHFMHLFNKYLIIFVPGSGDTRVSKIDLLMLRSLAGTWGEWMKGEICVSLTPKQRCASVVAGVQL